MLEGGMVVLYTRMDSPLGELLIVGDGTCLTGLTIQCQPDSSWQQGDFPLFDAANGRMFPACR